MTAIIKDTRVRVTFDFYVELEPFVGPMKRYDKTFDALFESVSFRHDPYAPFDLGYPKIRFRKIKKDGVPYASQEEAMIFSDNRPDWLDALIVAVVADGPKMVGDEG